MGVDLGLASDPARSVAAGGVGTAPEGGRVEAQAEDGTATRRSDVPRRRPLRAQVRAALFLALWLPAIGLWLRSGLAVPPVPFMTDPLPMVAALTASALCAAVGLAISVQRYEVRTGRYLAWAAWALALNQVTWAYLALAERDASVPAPAIAAWLNSAVAFPAATAVIIALVAVFPTDRPASHAGRTAIVLASVAAALVTLGSFLRPGSMPLITGYESPFGSPGLAAIGFTLQVIGWAAVVLASGIDAASVLVRYSHPDAVTRAQLRVFMAVVLFTAVAFVLMIVTSTLELATPRLRDLISAIALAGVALIPLAVFVTIARYRLYQIDRLVSRSFVYGALTAIVAGLTAASVQLLTAITKLVTDGSSELVIVFTTLILVSLSAPIKARLEKVAARITRDPREQAEAVAPVDPPAAASAVPADGRALLAALDGRIHAALAAELGRPPVDVDDGALLAGLDARIELITTEAEARAHRSATGPAEDRARR